MKYQTFPLVSLQDLRNLGPLNFYSRFQVDPVPLIHVGAHLAEEKDSYFSMGFKDIFWIEANPAIYAKLSKIVGEEFSAQALVWSEEGKVFSFNVSNNSVSSSIFDFAVEKPWGEVKMIDQIHLVSTTLDHLYASNPRLASLASGALVILDIQGAELPALQGARELLSAASGLIVEISKKTTYVGGTDFTSLHRFLKSAGFVKMGEWIDFGNGHGDALYVSKKVNLGLNARFLAKITWIANFMEFVLRVLSRRGLIKH